MMLCRRGKLFVKAYPCKMYYRHVLFSFVHVFTLINRSVVISIVLYRKRSDICYCKRAVIGLISSAQYLSRKVFCDWSIIKLWERYHIYKTGIHLLHFLKQRLTAFAD